MERRSFFLSRKQTCLYVYSAVWWRFLIFSVIFSQLITSLTLSTLQGRKEEGTSRENKKSFRTEHENHDYSYFIPRAYHDWLIEYLEKTWKLCQGMKPFTDSELIEKCMLDAIESVVANLSCRNELIKKIERTPVSNDTTTRRVERLSEDIVMS